MRENLAAPVVEDADGDEIWRALYAHFARDIRCVPQFAQLRADVFQCFVCVLSRLFGISKSLRPVSYLQPETLSRFAQDNINRDTAFAMKRLDELGVQIAVEKVRCERIRGDRFVELDQVAVEAVDV